MDKSPIEKNFNGNLLEKLMNIHQIPYSTHRCEAEIDNYIQANRHSWD